MNATARIIAIIILRGPHDAVQLKRPAMSKKNTTTLSKAPVIETRAVMISDDRIFIHPSLRKGISPAMFSINIKNPIHTPRTTINCCHVASSFIPNIVFSGPSSIWGRVAGLSKMFSVFLSIPPINALVFSSARINGVTSKASKNRIVKLFFIL